MRVILSSPSPRDSWYSTDAGQVLYKVGKSGSGVTTLRKAVAGGDSALCAEVEFHTFRSTRFRFNNVDVSVEQYFRKEGWFNPKWVFSAADGREYYWKLDGSHLEMFRKDGRKQQVVKFREHKRSFGPFITGRPASLEVDNGCVPILDEIMMTFVYCQKQRKKRQARRRAGANAGASAGASGASGGGTSC